MVSWYCSATAADHTWGCEGVEEEGEGTLHCAGTTQSYSLSTEPPAVPDASQEAGQEQAMRPLAVEGWSWGTLISKVLQFPLLPVLLQHTQRHDGGERQTQ